MEDLKQILAKNITALRQAGGMTQLELAEKLNYSDKAISKWERGESIPDVTVLKAIADLFGVTLDYLLEEEHKQTAATLTTAPEIPERKHRNHKVITMLSILIVWFIATFVFVVLDTAMPGKPANWLPFFFGLPATMVVWLVFNSMWFYKRRNYLIISLLMWTALLAVFLSVAVGGFEMWRLFLLGIPGQVAIFVWSRFQRKNKKQ